MDEQAVIDPYNGINSTGREKVTPILHTTEWTNLQNITVRERSRV